MRSWLIRALGGVTERDHNRAFKAYQGMCENTMQQIVDRHEMQGAWAQVKAEHKARRYH